MRLRQLAAIGGMLAALWGVAAAEAPNVRPERPRVFWRAKAWDGPSIQNVRGWMDRDEYRKRLVKLTSDSMRSQAGDGSVMVDDALLYLLTDDAEAGRRAVQSMKAFKISGSSPSYSGIEAQKLAAAYDWLHDHPDLDAEARKAIVAHMETWADGYHKSLASGGPSTPFYSRVSGALGGLTALGLALHGDSEKVEGYVAFAAEYLKTKLGTIRQMEDGATGGGSYGYHHEFTDLANIAAAWRSATDWDAARWIREQQGDWLQRQLLYQIWHTYPNGWFVKDGDIWSGSHTDKTQFMMSPVAITGMYRSGVGRTFLDQAQQRWGIGDFHAAFVWQWFVFNDPTVEPVPLSTLGRTATFSPTLHGFVAWRSSWEPDATIVHFKCGETVDHHASYDQGRFTIFKRAPLAIKSGAYVGGYGGRHHMYYKSPWSANCVLFTGEKHDGMQPRIDFDGTPSWTEWKAARDKRYPRPPTGVLEMGGSNDDRVLSYGNLDGSAPPGCKWSRRMVFLGFKYLVVLDLVTTAPGIRQRWTLHTVNQPKVDGMTVMADNPPGRLFCRTLLPAGAQLVLVGGEGHEFDYNGSNRKPGGYKGLAGEPKELQYGEWRLDVTPPPGRGPDTIYLHVLYPTDTKTDAMPECSVKQTTQRIEVKVGELSHAFQLRPAP